MVRVAFVNLGCRVNRVEIDLIASELVEAGCTVVPLEDAQLVVVNTCAVTGEAQAKTRKAVRHAAHLPQRPWVVATGCVANLFEQELSALGPNVVVEPLKSRVATRGLEMLGLSPQAAKTAEGDNTGVHITPTGRTRPGVKVQDGCNNRCTFCIVWKARGPSRSLPVGEVVGAIQKAASKGAHEVVLTGINLGNYRDESEAGCVDLPGLLTRLLEQTEIERLRLSSIEPPDVTIELLDVMANSQGRIAPFLHVCLQSGCDATLKRMGRVYDTTLFRELVHNARDRMPNIALGTDLIVGFPGETNEEFNVSLDFVREMAFARMHVFRYSRRPGTPAATFADQVSAATSAERAAKVRELARTMRHDAMSALVGTCGNVIVEHKGRAVDTHLYDVLVDESLLVGSLVTVRFDGMEGNTLLGHVKK